VGEQEDDLGIAQQAALTENALTENGLVSNGLVSNGLVSNGLVSNGLVSNGLVMDALSNNPLAQTFLQYVVSCALPSTQSITLTINNTSTTFTGQLGLAPAWGTDNGTCDGTCRAWISACVLARVNFLGEHVALSLRGPAGILSSSGTERTDYPDREATYYGDIFSTTQKRYACRSPASPLISRVCGPDWATNGCVMNIVNTCDLVCTGGTDSTEGYYKNCRDSDNITYPIAITVYRKSPQPLQ
jgi:hypothetical protein